MFIGGSSCLRLGTGPSGTGFEKIISVSALYALKFADLFADQLA